MTPEQEARREDATAKANCLVLAEINAEAEQAEIAYHTRPNADTNRARTRVAQSPSLLRQVLAIWIAFGSAPGAHLRSHYTITMADRGRYYELAE